MNQGLIDLGQPKQNQNYLVCYNFPNTATPMNAPPYTQNYIFTKNYGFLIQ